MIHNRRERIKLIFIPAIIMLSLTVIGLYAFFYLYFDLLLHPRVHEVSFDTLADHVESIELVQDFEAKNKDEYVVKVVVSSEKQDALLQSLSDLKYYTHFTGPWYPYGDCFLIHYIDGATSFICRTGIAQYDKEGQEIDVSYGPYKTDRDVFYTLWDELAQP